MKTFLSSVSLLLLLVFMPIVASAESLPLPQAETVLKLSDRLLELMKPPQIVQEPELPPEESRNVKLTLKPELLALLGLSASPGRPVDQEATETHPIIPSIESIYLVDDRLYIESSERVKLNTFYLSNPSRLVIDIQSSRLAKGLHRPNGDPAGEIKVSSKLVDQIRYSLFQTTPSTVRIVLDLKTRAQAVVLPASSPNQTILQLSEAKYTVVIDAGHGGHDSGAISITGKYEKDFNLSMVKKVRELLMNEPRIQAHFTRLTDIFVPLDDRVMFAEDRDADLFVSIHGNSFSPQRSGTETYYYNANSLSLAKLMHSAVLNATSFHDGQVRKERFRVITMTTMPAVLLEIGYLSNAKEERELFNETFQYRVAESIVMAIKQYLDLQ